MAVRGGRKFERGLGMRVGRLFAVFLMGSAVASLTPAAATAEMTFYNDGDLSLKVGVEGALAGFRVNNADFGRGNNNFGSSELKTNRSWFEGWVKPSLTFEYVLDDSPIYLGKNSSFYGGLSAIVTATRGQGDAVQATSTTSFQPTHGDFEEAYLGWKSGDLFEMGEDAIDVSFGNQSLTIGDGLLINGATTNGLYRAAYYTAPRGAFHRTLVLKVNPSEIAPVRGTFFHLQAVSDQDLMREGDQPQAKLYGGSIDWYGPEREEKLGDISDLWTLTGTAFRIYDGETPPPGNTAGNRKGLNVFSARAAGSFLPFNRDILFFGEYVAQRNDDTGRRTRANGWYVEPGYNFSSHPWNPIVTYRYGSFSGDPDPNGGTTKKSFDSLFFGSGVRGLGPGTWFLGEIYGQYQQGLTNVNVHQLSARITPMEDLSLGLIYYRTNFNELGQVNQLINTGATPVTSKRAMDEINLYAEWKVNDVITIVPTLGVGFPGAGYKQVDTGTGRTGDKTIFLGQIVVGFQF